MLLLPLVCLVSYAAAALVPCGVPTVQPVTKRIVGGRVAVQGSWPWTILMTDALNYITGSGVLIGQNVILTSAQHFEGRGYTESDLLLHWWKVYAGEYNISTTDPHEKYYHIRRVIVHPGYNYTTLENDIALVFTTQTIQYNAHTRPGCLADAGHTATVGITCYLPGWGGTKGSGNEEVMNQVDLPILHASVCQGHYPGFLPNTEICAGYEGGHKDWCVDDIGSPLMCQDQTGTWHIQGLASSGGNCTAADEPGVFENVSQYSQWIKQAMQDAGYPYQY